MSKGKIIEAPGMGASALQPSAFTTVKSVEEAAAKAIAGRLSVYHRNFHAVSSPTRRLIVVRFHIPFWRRVQALEGNKKPFPPSGRNGQLSQAIADGFPHWSKLQHRAP
jgi:hypothetical protein